MGKALIYLLTGALLLSPTQLVGGTGRVVIAVVRSCPQGAFTGARQGFIDALGDRGYDVKPQDVALDDLGRLDAVAPDLILALGTGAADKLAARTLDHPVVYAVVADPAGVGGSSSAPRLGVASIPPARAQLELIRECMPDAIRIGLVYNPNRTANIAQALRAASPGFGLTIVDVPATRAADVAAALHSKLDSYDAVLAVADASIWNRTSLKASVILSLQKRKPIFGFSKSFTRAGAIASVSAEDYADMGAQAGLLAASTVLEGSRGHRFEGPRSLTWSVNKVVARRLGIEPPKALVDRAQEVFR